MGPSLNIDPLLTEQPLSQQEYDLRVEFVKAYMRTRDAFRATVEIGFHSAYAFDWAKTFMSEGVVQRLIAEAETSYQQLLTVEQKRNRYIAWAEQCATDRGPDATNASRVSAIALLMKVHGMDKSEPEEDENGHRGGVMMVPQLTDPDTWGSVASRSQLALKQVVRE